MARRAGDIPPVRPQTPMAQAVRIMPPPQREAMAAETQALAAGDDDADFEAVIGRCVDEGVQYDEENMQPGRLKAWQYYRGEMRDMMPYEGGSSVVSHDVRDTVQAAIPSFLRVFFAGGESIVEFSPSKPTDDEFCTQATDYISKLVRDELGVIGAHAAIMDAMMNRVGIVTWWWDESERVETRSYTGLDEAAFALATEEPDENTTVDVTEQTERMVPVDPRIMLTWRQMAQHAQAAGQQPPPPPQPEKVIDCTVRYTTTTPRLRIEPVPPEERIMSPRARSLATAPYCGRRRIMRVYELVAMGYDRDEVLEHASAEGEVDEMDEATRNPSGTTEPSDELIGDDYREVEYCMLWIRADRDGDGIAELREVCTIGVARHIVSDEPCMQARMAEFRLMPTPHSTSGDSLAQDVFDVQRMKSGTLRLVMESAPHSIYPRWVGVDGKVNWNDLLSLAPGQPTRVKDLNALTSVTTPYQGDAALGLMTYIDENVRDPRTGLSKFARGLDPDALQSTPTAAAGAAIGATQMQLEGYARMLAETGFRQLYKGLLREVVMHQRDPAWMQVNGKWMQVDPRTWNADLQVSVDPAPGTGDLTGKITALQAVIGMQTTAMEKLGPSNPLVNLQHLYNAMAKFVQLSGLGRNTSRYFGDPSQQPPADPSQAPKPPEDPAAAQAAALAQAEVEKAKLNDDTKRYQLQLEDDRERDKLEAEIVLKSVELTGKFGVQVDPIAIIQAMRLPRPPGTLPPPVNPHNPPPAPAPQPGMGA